jgi:hypothetical protein
MLAFVPRYDVVRQRIDLVTGYVSYAIKHVHLDYTMTPLDEIRIQAFILGNRNSTYNGLRQKR